MALNPLIREQLDQEGNTIYVIAQEDITVRASQSTGLAPTLTYWINGKDMTEDVRKLRMLPNLPHEDIEGYEQFQANLFKKEELAIATMYQSFSMMPKNMSTGKQLLWGLLVFLLIVLPIFIVVLMK